MRGRWFGMKRVIWLFLGLVFWYAGPNAPAVSAVRVGDNAPDFTLKGLDNRNYSLSDYRGKVVFVNFFGWR